MEDKGQDFYRIKYEEEKRKAVNYAMELGDARTEILRLQEELKEVLEHGSKRKGDGTLESKEKLYQLAEECMDRKTMKYYGKASFPSVVTRKSQQQEIFPLDMKVSILVMVLNTNKTHLKEMITCVIEQTYGNWELCIVDVSDESHTYVGELCKTYSKQDQRIRYHKLSRNQGELENLNQCCEVSNGQYIGILDQNDLLHPCLLFDYVQCIIENDADYIYCDEATFRKNDINQMVDIRFKPDYAIDTLRAMNYIGNFSMFHKELLQGKKLFRPAYEGGHKLDMTLRMTSRANRVIHIPKVLYYSRFMKGEREISQSSKTYIMEASKSVIRDHLSQCGYNDVQVLPSRMSDEIFRIKYSLMDTPKISIIIHNQDATTDIARCVESILHTTMYQDYEVIIIEHDSVTDDIQSYYRQIEQHKKIRLIQYEGEDNEAKIYNYGASMANGEYLIFLTNDTKVIVANWIEELVMYAQREDVGAVGAKLYDEERRIQHAGLVIGLGSQGTADYILQGVEEKQIGYMGRLAYAQNVSAVSGSCLMVKKDKFREVGGFDKAFTHALGDIDFCLKLQEEGYVNVWNPYCELYCYDKKVRKIDRNQEDFSKQQIEVESFRWKWIRLIQLGDPHYNVNFSLERTDYALRI